MKGNRRQTAAEIAWQREQTIGRRISRFTVASELHKVCLYAQQQSAPLSLTHQRRRELLPGT